MENARNIPMTFWDMTKSVTIIQPPKIYFL